MREYSRAVQTHLPGELALMHSKFLVHWTGHRDLESLPDHEKKEKYALRLKDWYQNGLFTKRTSDPELAIRLPEPGHVNKLKNEEFVRLCFTEVRLSQAKEHSKRYGRLAIGFTSDLIANKGGRPVIYLPWEAKARLLEQSIFRAWEQARASGNAELEQLLGWIVAFCKPMSERPGTPHYVSNYDEMEWRMVYGGPLDTSGTFTEDRLVPDAFRVKFDPADVSLIVFPDAELMRTALDDNDMKPFFEVHQPDLLLLDGLQSLLDFRFKSWILLVRSLTNVDLRTLR
jgi:hypothetical protein